MPRQRRNMTGSIAAAVPVALGLLGPATHPASITPAARVAMHTTRTGSTTSAAKQFAIPMANLQTWATSVLTTVANVQIDGHSAVHPINNDCEMHLGGHSTAFQGVPDGLVLEPMNACVLAFPGQPQQNDKDWTNFGDHLVQAIVTATGVPRIWPEHLNGGTASNPNHAVELHPLTAIADGSTTTDFTANIFAGQYQGGVGQSTAFSILNNTTVDVTRSGETVNVDFLGGTIGNFTLLDVEIDPTSIVGDGAGSFRMSGVVVTTDTTVPVRLVSIKGTGINDAIGKMRSTSGASVSLEALVLFSLSPQALVDAASKSTGGAQPVDRPIQLIVYGTPDDR